MSLSGTALAGMVRVRDPLSQVQQLAQHLGILKPEDLDTQQVSEALRGVDAMKILEAGDIFKVWNNAPLLNYGAVVEQDATSESFFNEDFNESHLAGRINQVPWLLGVSSRAGEGGLFLLHIYSNPQFLKEFNENFLEYFRLSLFLPEKITTESVKDLLELYDVKELELNEHTLVPLSNILGDFNFYYPLYVAAEVYTGYSQEPVSIYKYEYRSLSNISFSRAYSEGVAPIELQPAHLDDGLHTIRMPILLPDFPKDSEDHLVIKRLTSLLVEFARTGYVLRSKSYVSHIYMKFFQF